MPWMRFIPKQVDTKDKRDFCNNANVKVLSGTSGDCTNTPVKITALKTGAIIKVPVILAELTLQLNIDAIVDLPLIAGEVTDVKNNVKVSQCQLIPRTNKLFVKGCISQSIEYKTISSIYDGKFETLNQCTIEIPLGCTTSVDYNGGEPLEPIPNDSKAFEYHTHSICSHSDKNYDSPGDTIEKNRISTENFNDLPYCELISSQIVEFDRYINSNNIVKGKSIKSIEEKMVVYLTIKILQNQQIEVIPKALRAVTHEDS